MSDPGPLNGVRVVELGMWAAGPACSAVLGDWGADVVKIEDPRTGDPMRGFQVRRKDDPNLRVSPSFAVNNRNKRSLTLNLSSAPGLAVALDLVGKADVFVSNFRPGALERLGLDPDRLTAKFPRLIYGQMTGYGHVGPERDRAAFDYGAGWARAGIMASIGEPSGPPPGQRPAMIDHPAGLSLAGGIAAALFERTRTGKGQIVRTSLFQMGMWMKGVDLQAAMLGGALPLPESRFAAVNPLFNSYRTKDGRWIYLIMMQGDRHWRGFCRAVGRFDWADDESLQTMRGRFERSREIVAQLDELFATKTFDEWTRVLDDDNLFWAKVQNDDEVLADPQAAAVEAWGRVADAAGVESPVLKSPIGFSRSQTSLRLAAPEVGQHTEEVLLELGYTWEQVAELKEQGAIG
ncbi:MAG TPA: CoA transferase [Candidatus Kryptonia bacterium]|nr:CoA transferase [Candidatus Kryptonia bacterium]